MKKQAIHYLALDIHQATVVESEGDSWGRTFFFRIQPAVSTSCRR